jgi:DNA-directed RNA polymerase subunit delta
MSSIKSRVAYLKGLADGLGIKDESKESKVILEMISLLDNMCDRIEELEEAQYEFEDYLDSMNEDLNDIEEDFYDEGDCDYDYDDFIELKCPNCSEVIYIEDSTLEGYKGLKCPNCQSLVVDKDNITEEKIND